MHIQTNIPLSTLTTMRLGGIAHQVAEFSTKPELEEIITYAKSTNLPYFVIGGGSNIIARETEYPGIILLSKMKGFDIIEDTDTTTTIRIGAGENWDKAVEKMVNMGLSGCEAMSAIPGTVGATPVQNVGAYGQEIADTFVELEALDTETMTWTTIDKDNCRFSYRNSIFKDPIQRHHIITSVTLCLNKTWLQPPFYDSLQKYFDSHGSTDNSPQAIRDAVIAIRASKLPDPAIIANTGSFFKNPIVTADIAKSLADSFPEMPQFPMRDGTVKLAAGWLIEKAGLKGYSSHGLRTFDSNALVVVNESASSYTDLEAFTSEIIKTVFETYGITLEQEPETL